MWPLAWYHKYHKIEEKQFIQQIPTLSPNYDPRHQKVI
jgi:hypothetical protein